MSRITVGTRIQRLLAILQWIAAEPDGVEISAACERFAMTRSELLGELTMASMIGDGSANFDDMPFLVIIEDSHVEVSLLSFRQPLRMTRGEQLALFVAARALTDPANGGADPLNRALTKLADHLGLDPALVLAVDVDVDHDGGPQAATLERAIVDRRRVTFTYWTYSRDAVAERSVDPWLVFSRDDQWYLSGLDVDQGQSRVFRLDRIHDLTVGDEPASPAPAGLSTSLDFPTDLPVVELDLPASASWVVEAYPTLAVEQAGDRLRVKLAVTGPSFVERILLRVGPQAVVTAVDPELGDLDLAGAAAQRVAARYRR